MKIIKKLKKKFNESVFNEILIVIKRFHKEKQQEEYLRSFLPDYYNVNFGSIFLHTQKIPENSNALLEVKNLKKIMIDNGFKKYNITSDNDSFRSIYYHKKYGMISIWIYMDDVCDIKYIKQTVKKAQLTGLCAEVLKELNN